MGVVKNSELEKWYLLKLLQELGEGRVEGEWLRK
jgi:hypothetical protein